MIAFAVNDCGCDADHHRLLDLLNPLCYVRDRLSYVPFRLVQGKLSIKANKHFLNSYTINLS